LRAGTYLPVIGVDIGQRRDPTAIAVVEVELRPVAQPERRLKTGEEAHYLVRFLGRLPLGTPYPEVARRIVQLCAQVKARSGRAPVLYVDATGVGLPVVDQLRASNPPVARLDAVLFTGGEQRTEKVEENRVMLGKAFIVSRLQSLLQFQRIHLPNTPEAATLARELQDFEIRVDEKAHQRSGAFRVGTHDDLVTALGLTVQKEPIRRGPENYEL
jgi:hypothetical protein